MAFQNLKADHFTATEKTQFSGFISQMEVLMQPKLINLSEKDMRKYKKLNKKQIMFINKDNDYHENQPALDSPDVNWAEFENDFSSRAFLNQAALRLRALANAFEETARLHDYDNL